MRIFKLVTKGDCDYCHKAVELILENGDDFALLELKTQDQVELFKFLGNRTVPHIAGIGGYTDLVDFYNKQ